jgi:cytoskeleton protein RodZ
MTANANEDIGSAAGRNQAPGMLLRAARLAQNLGVADVARQLKLSINQVEALEAGDFERLPGPVFVRGFARNYARLLRLDVEVVLRQVEACLPREEPRPAAPPSQEIPFPTNVPRRWRGYAAAVVVIVAALAAYEFWPTTAPEPPAREPVVAAPAAPPAAPPETVTGSGSAPGAAAGPAAAANEMRAGAPPRPATGQPLPQAGTAAIDGAHGAVQAVAGAPAAQETPPAAAKSAAREEEPAPGPGERQVHMVFEQASWVEIRDRSGRAIFSQLNPPGTEQRVNGRPPLAVVVGNAHGVRLTYDERLVNLAVHTKVDVARLTLQ